MQNFDNIQELWKKAPTDLPSSKEIITEVEKARKKMMWKSILAILLLAGTFIFISFIGFHYDFEIRTTIAGIVITLIAICFGIFFNTGLIKVLQKNADGTVDNQTYLKQLKEIQTKQRFIQTTGISVYFVMLTIGILLYMYEFAVRDLTFGIVAYSITLAWIAFNWFYLRKRTVRKQEKIINDQIEKIESLIKQNNL